MLIEGKWRFACDEMSLRPRPIELICCLAICTREVIVNGSEDNDAYLRPGSDDVDHVDHQRWRRREYS